MDIQTMRSCTNNRTESFSERWVEKSWLVSTTIERSFFCKNPSYTRHTCDILTLYHNGLGAWYVFIFA